MKSYPFKRRTVPRPARVAGFTDPVLDPIMDHPVASMDRHFTPNVALPTRGEAGVEPTPDEGIRVLYQ